MKTIFMAHELAQKLPKKFIPGQGCTEKKSLVISNDEISIMMKI